MLSVTLQRRDTCPGISPCLLRPGRDPVEHKDGAFPLTSTVLTPGSDAPTPLPRTHRASRQLTQNQNGPGPWPPSPPLDLLTSSPTPPPPATLPPAGLASLPLLGPFPRGISPGHSSLRGLQLHLLAGAHQWLTCYRMTLVCVQFFSLPCELREDRVLVA